MLVIFGASGRTGVEVLKEALARGMAVRPVCRDDRDARPLNKIVDVQNISYADANHASAVPPVLEGATAVVSCINARTAGPGSAHYERQAGANIVKAAVDAGIERILHLSVVGAYRWSPNQLNRESFRIDREVRLLKDLPWTVIRVSCYHDEVIEGHVRPPDGGKPHRLLRKSRYSPISHQEVGRIVVDAIDSLIASRTWYIGGPETWTGEELARVVAPFVEGSGLRTRYGALPPGDMSVLQETTLVSVGEIPRDRLIYHLDPSTRPQGNEAADPGPPLTEPEPVYRRDSPGPHPLDDGRDLRLLREMGPVLRRVVHDQLARDLVRLGIEGDIKLDFRSARARKGGRSATAHGGTMTELTGVRALDADGNELHRASVCFFRDELAEEFRCWFERSGTDAGIPAGLWDELDLGVKRRLVDDPAFANDPRVQGFKGGHEAA